MSKSSISNSLASFLKEKEASLVSVIQNYERELRFKEKTKIVVLADIMEDGTALAEYLTAKGFKDVNSKVPETKGKVKIKADVIIFHRSSIIKEYKHIPDEYVTKYVKAHWENQALLYFGPYHKGLDTRVDQLVFANYRQKLTGNILEMLEDREMENPK